MRFIDGAVGYKFTQKVTKVFLQDSYELGHDCEDKISARPQAQAGDPDAEARDSDAGFNEQPVNDRDKLNGGANDKDDEEREEEIEYRYRVADEEAELEDKDEVDTGDQGNLGPKDGEKN